MWKKKKITHQRPPTYLISEDMLQVRSSKEPLAMWDIILSDIFIKPITKTYWHRIGPILIRVQEDYGGDASFDSSFSSIFGVNCVVCLETDDGFKGDDVLPIDIVDDVVHGVGVVIGVVKKSEVIIMPSQGSGPTCFTSSGFSHNIQGGSKHSSSGVTL